MIVTERVCDRVTAHARQQSRSYTRIASFPLEREKSRGDLTLGRRSLRYGAACRICGLWLPVRGRAFTSQGRERPHLERGLLLGVRALRWRATWEMSRFRFLPEPSEPESGTHAHQPE